MKKIYLTIILLVISATQLDAQFFKFNIGLHGGASYNMLLGTNNDSQLAGNLTPDILKNIGGYGGLNVEFRFGRVLGLSFEGNYAYSSYGFKYYSIANHITQHYIQIPMMLQLWMGRSAIFEVGLQQSILIASAYKEAANNVYISPDPGALQYSYGLIGGFKFNLSRVVFLNLRAMYGLSDSYIIGKNTYPNLSAQIGLGFRLYGHRERAF